MVRKVVIAGQCLGMLDSGHSIDLLEQGGRPAITLSADLEFFQKEKPGGGKSFN